MLYNLKKLLLVVFIIIFVPIVYGAADSVKVGVALSWDGGITYTTEEIEFLPFICGGADETRNYGSYVDTWGRTWNSSDFSNTNFRARINFTSRVSVTGTPNPKMDHIEVSVNFTAPGPPVLTFENPTPANNTNIGATFRVNASVDNGLIGCKLEENSTGSFVNTTMNVIAGNTCFINKRGMPDGVGFLYKVIGENTIGEGNSETRIATVVNTAPTLVINTPANHTATALNSMIFNITVTDLESDLIDIIVRSGSNTDDFNQTIVIKFGEVGNGTYVGNFSYIRARYPQQDNIYAWYHLDESNEFGENESLAYDFSGNGLNGTITNATISTLGNKSGYSFDKDLQSRIQIGNGTDFNNICDIECTFSALVWYIDVGAEETIFGKRDDDATENYFRFVVQADRFTVEFYEGPGAIPSNLLQAGVVLQTNSWYLLTFTRNSSGQYLYIDGVLNDTGVATVTPNWSGSTEPMFIGAQNADGIEFEWNGSIAEAIIWNVSLTADEVLDLARLRADKYFWNITATDLDKTNESSGNDFGVLYDGGDLDIVGNIGCSERWVFNENLTVDTGGNVSIIGSGSFTLDGGSITNWYNVLIGRGCKYQQVNGAKFI